MAGYIALLLRRRGLLIAELRSSRDEVARLAAADAVADERLRFARDLHDLLGHSLSVIVLKAELARRLLDHEQVRSQARDEVDDVEQIARRALEEVREAVTGYRARSLPAEIERTRVALEAAGVEVHVEVDARLAAPRRRDPAGPGRARGDRPTWCGTAGPVAPRSCSRARRARRVSR